MILKNYKIFKENYRIAYDFKVTEDMVLNGKLIKEVIPNIVHGHFYCNNLNLTSLEGCPTEVFGAVDCSNNQLTSLKGCPSLIGESFYCDNNQLTTLKEGPIIVGGTIDCSSNKLTSLEGCPVVKIKTYEIFYCFKNIVDLTIERKFIISTYYTNQETYWPDLLQYMLDEKIDLNKVYGWPNEFVKTLDDQYKNMFKSFKGLTKFKL